MVLGFNEKETRMVTDSKSKDKKKDKEKKKPRKDKGKKKPRKDKGTKTSNKGTLFTILHHLLVYIS